MSPFVMLPSRTHLRAIGALLIAFALGCGDRVDLGGPPPPPPPDAGTSDDGSARTLFRFSDKVGGCIGVGVDDNHLYFSTPEQGDAGPIPSVHRCRKTDCAATLTRVARPPCANCYYTRIERSGDRIGFTTTYSEEIGGFAHIAACTPPDCSDLQMVTGEFASLNGVAFAGSQVYFGVGGDNTIYGCGFPSCPEGPRSFVRGTLSGELATTREWVYWVNNRSRSNVSRKRRDGSSEPEALDLGAVLGPEADGGIGSKAAIVAQSIAAHDGWLYALVASTSDPDIACAPPGGACVIARWPDDALGKPREIVYKSAAPINRGIVHTPIRILGGLLVFTVEQGYSCDPADCTATLRAHDSFNPNRIASDGEYLYWCAMNPADGQGELRRSARLR
jgi:hypothetical protein